MKNFILLFLVALVACNGATTHKIIKPKLTLEKVKVKKEHFVDKGDQNKDGSYGYYYEYDIYDFCKSKICYSVRAYTDTPEEASFMSSKNNYISINDFSEPLFIYSYFYLKEKEGKTKIKYLTGSGYKEIKLIE